MMFSMGKRFRFIGSLTIPAIALLVLMGCQTVGGPGSKPNVRENAESSPWSWMKKKEPTSNLPDREWTPNDVPDGCVEKFKVIVDDRANLFFHPSILAQLRAEAVKQQNGFVVDVDSVPPNGSPINQIKMRTQFNGGLRDLYFIRGDGLVGGMENQGVLSAPLTLTYASGRPQLKVSGTLCFYSTPQGTTLDPSRAERTSGNRQNFHNMGSFLIHHITEIANRDGCRSDTLRQMVGIEVTANGARQPIPDNVVIRAKPAESGDGTQIADAIFDDSSAGLGKAEIGLFSIGRPN